MGRSTNKDDTIIHLAIAAAIAIGACLIYSAFDGPIIDAREAANQGGLPEQADYLILYSAQWMTPLFFVVFSWMAAHKWINDRAWASRYDFNYDHD